MKVYGAAVAHVLIFPHTLVNCLSKKGDIFILQKQDQQIVLLGGERYDLPAPGDHPGLGVHHHVAHRDPVLRLVIAAQHGLHPGQQLRDLKGFDDIVVGPQAQALDPVLHRAAGGDENDGDLQGRQVLHQLEAVHPRKHHVQKDQVVPLGLHRVGGVRAVVQTVAGVARRGKAHVQQVRNGLFIFYNEYFNHGFALFLCRRRAARAAALPVKSFSRSRPGTSAIPSSPGPPGRRTPPPSEVRRAAPPPAGRCPPGGPAGRPGRLSRSRSGASGR